MDEQSIAVISFSVFFFGMYALAILLLCASVLHWIFRGHKWQYRNPYDRMCKRCSRHEVGHSWDLGTRHQWWWEVFEDGNAGYKCIQKSDDK